MERYPVPKATEIEQLVKWCAYVQRLREDDIADFNNLNAVFMRGRKVGKIPSASNDVADSDRIGDFSYDASYMYLLVDNSGAEWRRISLGVW